jgi:hypothetical protein
MVSKNIFISDFILTNFIHFNKILLPNKLKSINKVPVYYQTLPTFETYLINILFCCLFILFLLFIEHNWQLLGTQSVLTLTSSMLPVVFISKNSSEAKKIIAYPNSSSNTTTSLVPVATTSLVGVPHRDWGEASLPIVTKGSPLATVGG